MAKEIELELIKPSAIELDLQVKTIHQEGGSGTKNYNLLDNKPQINGVTLQSNKTLDDLGITSAIGTEVETYVEAHKDELKGDKGDDGYSPSARVEQSSGGAIVTVTDKSGTTTATISDGQDGFSPVANVVKSGKTATITVTDENGTTTAQISDGTDGTNGTDGTDGQDGFSPIASVSKVGNTATISITDASGTTTAQISDGQDGADGQDYVLTSQDKTDIATLVYGMFTSAESVSV